MPRTANVDTYNSLYVMDHLASIDAPAPDDAVEDGNTLHLIYASAGEATATYTAAQQIGLPLASLDDVTQPPWERAEDGMYYVTFEHEELERGN